MTAWDYWGRNGRWGRPSPSSYRLTLVEKATDQPISFEQACDHLRLGDPASAEAVAQQAMVERMIRAAVGEVQRYCDLAVLTQKWKLVAETMVSPYMLPKAPLQSVDKVSDESGNVIDAASYSVVLDERLPGLLVGATGPVVEFTAGWKTPDDVPDELVQAMLLMVGTWFMNRESAQAFTLTMIPGVGVTELLDPFRLEVIA
jgi:uncharacterized phiE125 gp8 family phage protein